LDDILSHDSSTEYRLGIDDDQSLLRDCFELLSVQRGAIIDTDQRQLLTELSQRLTKWSQQRPALIRQAATVERLLLAGQVELPACSGCIDELSSRLWTLLSPWAATARHGRRYYFSDDELVNSYLNATRPQIAGGKRQ
jgi:hypothetical protein